MTLVYLLLADFGIALISSGTGNYELALSSTVFRVIALAVWSLGWSTIQTGARKSISSIALLVGMLSLAGFPLTPGFPTRWALFASISGIEGTIILGSMAIGTIAVMLSVFPKNQLAFNFQRPDPGEVLMMLGITACVILGVAPAILSLWIRLALEGFPNLIAA